MTQEERDQLMAKVIDAPQALTDTEIESLVHDSELRQLYNTAVLLKSGSMKMARTTRALPQWAATIALLIGLGAVAATVVHYAAPLTAPTSVSEVTSQEQSYLPHKGAESETVLPCDLTFENLPLAEIAKTVADTFTCHITIADKSLESLRLYLTLPKGSTAAYFVTTIDSYEMLSATMHEDTITISAPCKRNL